ncbi:MAG: VOC family protein [Pyrinomonadaceae bacterium]|nr:VOC family protein [Pyrinomonadaceae bacterium]MDQ3133911.1 VOC family protein [Acidobacteriota bacterium]
MPRVVHFEISCDEPERAAQFYADVFGWKINKWDGPEEYWMAHSGGDDTTAQPGIDGGLMRRTEMFPSTVNTIDVPSVDDFIAAITAHGGTILMPKFALPGIGYLAYFKDTEGNTLGIMQADSSAGAR